MIQLTKIYLCNGEKSEPIIVDKDFVNYNHLETYKKRLKVTMSQRKGHKLEVNFEYKDYGSEKKGRPNS